MIWRKKQTWMMLGKMHDLLQTWKRLVLETILEQGTNLVTGIAHYLVVMHDSLQTWKRLVLGATLEQGTNLVAGTAYDLDVH